MDRAEMQLPFLSSLKVYSLLSKDNTLWNLILPRREMCDLKNFWSSKKEYAPFPHSDIILYLQLHDIYVSNTYNLIEENRCQKLPFL